MSLSAGMQLGAYEILGPLGAGGMGEVYRARDPKLRRIVAVKILSPAFQTDPDRLARFSREARSLAALNHPNIAAIYGLEEIDRPEDGDTGLRQFIVMELVEGVTLADRIVARALSVPRRDLWILPFENGAPRQPKPLFQTTYQFLYPVFS